MSNSNCKNIKVILAVGILVVVFVGACKTVEKEKSPDLRNTMNPVDYPVTQGSNPTRIISEKIFEYFTGLDYNQGDYFRIYHSGTSQAYAQYLEEETDIEMIIVQQADSVSEAAVMEYFFKPIAKDALVFITNIDNPIDNLTLTDIEAVLLGEITNWKQLGGNDEPINLFIRNELGGSQILLDKLVLRGRRVKERPGNGIANDMKEMSKSVAEKTGKGSTLGYTTYYFAEYSGKRDDIKTISISGVKASYETIKNGSYPLIANIYIGVKDLDGPAGSIFEWSTSEAGQEIIESTGYIPL